MVRNTLQHMATGGTYDREEGGFFRYSTTRDWSVPHFEKMSEDHAGLLRVLAQLKALVNEPWIDATLQSATAYVRTALRDAWPALPPGALGFALRNTAASLLALYIAFRMNLDDPKWAASTVWIVAQGSRGMGLSKSSTGFSAPRSARPSRSR